jgi:hypothetical protein
MGGSICSSLAEQAITVLQPCTCIRLVEHEQRPVSLMYPDNVSLTRIAMESFMSATRTQVFGCRSALSPSGLSIGCSCSTQTRLTTFHKHGDNMIAWRLGFSPPSSYLSAHARRYLFAQYPLRRNRHAKSLSICVSRLPSQGYCLALRPPRSKQYRVRCRKSREQYV